MMGMFRLVLFLLSRFLSFCFITSSWLGMTSECNWWRHHPYTLFFRFFASVRFSSTCISMTSWLRHAYVIISECFSSWCGRMDFRRICERALRSESHRLWNDRKKGNLKIKFKKKSKKNSKKWIFTTNRISLLWIPFFVIFLVIFYFLRKLVKGKILKIEPKSSILIFLEIFFLFWHFPF